MRQPPAGWQTVTPLPRSTQRRVQQFDAPAHGLPTWVQPPETASQRPGVEDAVEVPVEHPPEQQSEFAKQRSPFAWQEYAAMQVPFWQLVEQQSDP